MDFSFLVFGFLTGLSFILAIGPQNLFVIEQGLKNQFIFTVCIICSISDFILIFIGILLFHYIDIFHELNIHPLYPQIHEPKIILIPVFGIYHKLFSKSTPPPICS